MELGDLVMGLLRSYLALIGNHPGLSESTGVRISLRDEQRLKNNGILSVFGLLCARRQNKVTSLNGCNWGHLLRYAGSRIVVGVVGAYGVINALILTQIPGLPTPDFLVYGINHIYLIGLHSRFEQTGQTNWLSETQNTLAGARVSWQTLI